MSSREKFLAIVVGSLLACFAVYTVYNSVSGGLATRKAKIAGLQKQINQEKLVHAKSLQDAALVQEFKVRSLDKNVSKAKPAFYQWLNDQIEDVGLDAKGNVEYKGLGPSNDNYQELKYSITAEGDVQQVTELLYGIQSADTLHRIETFGVRQTGEDEKLRLNMNISALSMGDAGVEKHEIGKASDEKLTKSLDEYVDLISMRNMFAAANNPPKFDRLAKAVLELGEDDLDYRLKAKDPDGHRLSYTLLNAPDDSAEIDKRNLTWTPKELGKYEFEIEVKDDGLPSKTDVATLKVEVVEKEERKPEPPAEEFDEATLAFLTGFVKGPRDPEPGVWIDLRSKGENITLFAGDKIEIGKFKGVIKELKPFENKILLESEDGDEYEMRIGQKLSDRVEI